MIVSRAIWAPLAALLLVAAAPAQQAQTGALLVDHAWSLNPNLTVDANEQAANAVAFYVNRGFRVVGRSETDRDGRPYPLIHLELRAS